MCFRELSFTIKAGKKRSTYGRSPLFGISHLLFTSSRHKVLKLLDDYDLKVFSLFESAESLRETLAVRAREFRAKLPSPLVS